MKYSLILLASALFCGGCVKLLSPETHNHYHLSPFSAVVTAPTSPVVDKRIEARDVLVEEIEEINSNQGASTSVQGKASLR